MAEALARGRLCGLEAIAAVLGDGSRAEARASVGPDQHAGISALLARAGGLTAAETALLERARSQGIPVHFESEREMRRMSETDEAPALLAVIGPESTDDLGELMRRDGIVLSLVGLRYPANVGFILRSAEVAGAAGVVVSNAWQEAEWEEAHRVSMRARRFLPVLSSGAREALSSARAAGRRVIAVETTGAQTPWEIDFRGPTLLVIGGEAEGIPQAILAEADAVVRLPTRGFIPSYNVQAATSMLLGEYLRQTSGAPSR